MYSSSQQVDDHYDQIWSNRVDCQHEKHYRESIDVRIWEQVIEHDTKQAQTMEMMEFDSLEEYNSYWTRTLNYYEQQ